jgi:hypothetical protein
LENKISKHMGKENLPKDHSNPQPLLHLLKGEIADYTLLKV